MAAMQPQEMWETMRELVDRVFGMLEKPARESILDDCLDIVAELLGADRGLVVVVNDDGSTRAINARTRKRTLEASERQEISKTIIRRALDEQRCVTSDGSALGASSSATTLGILSAMAAPLRSPLARKGAPRAALYLDFRDPRKTVSREHIEFFMCAAQLLGAVLEQDSRGAVDRDQLREALAHRTDARRPPPLDELVPSDVRAEVRSAVASALPMLILGESGTGKTLLAQAVAEASGRRPIVRVTLGASDDLNTITSELFGHERGSFSGAVARRVGLVELANKGTLIFDELLNMPFAAQKLLLDFTQFGTYRPLGYERPDPKRSDVRIITATNGDLRAAVKSGRFREDLYHRLAAIIVELPPLRARREDVVALAERTLVRLDRARGWTLSDALKRLLVSPAIEWSGNVRQLERVIARARDRALVRDPESTELRPEHLESRDLDGVMPREPTDAKPAPPASEWQRLQAARSQIDENEQAVIRAALRDSDGVVSRAARELGIARTTLSSRIEALGLRAKVKEGS